MITPSGKLYAYCLNNPITCSDPYGLDPYQGVLAGGGSFISPGSGFSLFALAGFNYDGILNTSLYFQLQENGGLGFGYFAGWGGNIVGGSGAGSAPSTGLSSSGYAEADAGWRIAGSESGNVDENGNITAYTGAAPYKFGLGAGAGFFVGQSYTQTYVTPTLQAGINWISSFFKKITSTQSSPSKSANSGNNINAAVANQAGNAALAAATCSAMDAVNSAINPPSVQQAAPTATLTTELLGFGEDAADGGFILYPNMSNTNQVQSVYSKH